MFSKKSWFNLSMMAALAAMTATTSFSPVFGAEEKATDSASQAVSEKPSDANEQSKPAVEVIQNQISALRTGDVSRAYFTFTTKEFRQITSLENFRQFIKNFPVLSKVKTFDSQQKELTNSIWTIQGVLTSQDGETLGVEYEISQENGEWKIMGMQLFKPASKPASATSEVPKVIIPSDASKTAPVLDATKVQTSTQNSKSPVIINSPNGSINK